MALSGSTGKLAAAAVVFSVVRADGESARANETGVADGDSRSNHAREAKRSRRMGEAISRVGSAARRIVAGGDAETRAV
jgi:hypothetical protein